MEYLTGLFWVLFIFLGIPFIWLGILVVYVYISKWGSYSHMDKGELFDQCFNRLVIATAVIVFFYVLSDFVDSKNAAEKKAYFLESTTSRAN